MHTVFFLPASWYLDRSEASHHLGLREDAYCINTHPNEFTFTNSSEDAELALVVQLIQTSHQ